MIATDSSNPTWLHLQRSLIMWRESSSTSFRSFIEKLIGISSSLHSKLFIVKISFWVNIGLSYSEAFLIKHECGHLHIFTLSVF